MQKRLLQAKQTKEKSIVSEDISYVIKQKENTLCFVPNEFAYQNEPTYHNLYYDTTESENISACKSQNIIDRNIHPLKGSSHEFLLRFHKIYRIVQSFAPSLLPELAPAFVWDSNKNLHKTTQLPYHLPPHTTLDLATYFNSLYVSVVESFIGKRQLTIFLEFQGIIHMEVNGLTLHGHEEPLYSIELNIASRGWAYLPLPPVVASLQPHRIVVRVMTKDAPARIYNMHFATPEPEEKTPDRLAILIRTFKRVKECKRLLSTLSSHPSLNHSNVHVVLHDAGDEFSEAELANVCNNMKITLIKENNYGSSGNLVILLNHLRVHYSDAELKNTVAAILDDDILLHPESLLRAFSLCSLSVSETSVIVGSFLDRCRPMNIDATVAVYGEDLKRDSAMHLRPLLGGDQVNNSYYLNLSCQPVYGNIAAFYLLVARASLLTSVLPLPLFLKWDDIDYTATLYSRGAKLGAVPGISVWHDAFYDCMPVWQEVLNLKHGLIVDMVHLEHPWTVVFQSISEIIIRHLVVYDYNICEAMLDSVDEILGGCPSNFSADIITRSRQQIEKLSKSYYIAQYEAQRITPDSRTISICLASGESCKLSNGDTASVVHELFPQWKSHNPTTYIKHASAASRTMVLVYDTNRHESIMRRLKYLRKQDELFYNAQKAWKSMASNLRSQDNWQTILN
jgi:GT2 family glycosyltransferase